MKIKTVKPEKAMGIENSIIKAAQTGMIKNRVTEKELVSLLERESESRGEQKITVLLVECSSKGIISMMIGDSSTANYNTLIICYFEFNMYQNLSNTVSELSAKRQGIMKDLRNLQRSNIKQRVRS